MEHLADEQLVAIYLKGDRQALDLLIKRYLTPIFNYALSFVKDRAAAEDLTQEVFVKVWKKIRKFDNRYKFKSWLYVIAKNTALDYLKKSKAVNFSALQSDDGLLFEELLSASLPTPQAELEAARNRIVETASQAQLRSDRR